jgi:hypothetical protein
MLGTDSGSFFDFWGITSDSFDSSAWDVSPIEDDSLIFGIVSSWGVCGISFWDTDDSGIEPISSVKVARLPFFLLHSVHR